MWGNTESALNIYMYIDLRFKYNQWRCRDADRRSSRAVRAVCNGATGRHSTVDQSQWSSELEQQTNKCHRPMRKGCARMYLRVSTCVCTHREFVCTLVRAFSSTHRWYKGLGCAVW